MLESRPVEHSGPELLASACPDNPWSLVKTWFSEVSFEYRRRSGWSKSRFEWNSAQLSTVGSDGFPYCRTVLVKEASSEHGFVFFTDRASRKALQIRGHDMKCSLLFYWPSLSRQLLIVGHAEEMPRARVLRWWVGRSLISCATACAASQSSCIEDRAAWKAKIRENLRQMRQGLRGSRIAALSMEAQNATGFGVKPRSLEFWQGQPGRAHDRVIYFFGGGSGVWTRVQAAP